MTKQRETTRQSRRRFVQSALVAAVGTHLSGSSASPFYASSLIDSGNRIELGPPQYFNLSCRAGLAINPLTALVDERQGYLPYFDARYDTRPPVAVHIRWDYGDCIGRNIDALRLARIMSGSREGQHVDKALQKLSETLLGEHGLSWWPESPYKFPHPAGQPRRLADVCWTQRSTLAGLTTQYAVTGERHFADLAERLINGLSKLAIWRDGMAYFPREATQIKSGDVLYPPEGWSTDRMYPAGWFGAILGTLIWPLARFAALTGYEPAIRLARGLAEYCLRGTRLFRPDGRFFDSIVGHFYARTTTANGLLRLGGLIGNKEYTQMAERVYVHAREWGTSFGWFPEDLSKTGCETCCIKDMIELAISLALHVDDKYWNDAERFGRNHLLESQLLRIDWVDQYQPATLYSPPFEDPSRVTRDRVMERWLGGFAGWSGVNDWVQRGMMGCCNAMGARALYDLWHYGVTKSDEWLSVNLLLSKATEEVLVKSHLPFEGRVDIQCRKDQKMRVRVPDYVPDGSLRLEINDRPIQTHNAQGWLQLPPTKKGDVAIVRFELTDRSESVHLGYDTYDVIYRGDTVIAISPPGKVYPLYQRHWINKPPPELPEPAGAHGAEIDSI